MVCPLEVLPQVARIARALEEMGCVGVIVGTRVSGKGEKIMYRISTGVAGEIR